MNELTPRQREVLEAIHRSGAGGAGLGTDEEK